MRGIVSDIVSRENKIHQLFLNPMISSLPRHSLNDRTGFLCIIQWAEISVNKPFAVIVLKKHNMCDICTIFFVLIHC